MSKILIIEDDQGMIKLLTTILKSNGFTVVVAYDGLRGTSVAHDEKPDLILLDLSMPLSDGLTTLRNLKMSTHANVTPIIVISGTRDIHLIDQVKNMGIEEFITKPFDRDDLVAKIKAILSE